MLNDALTGAQLHDLLLPTGFGAARTLRFSPDSRLVCAVSDRARMAVWSCQTGMEVARCVSSYALISLNSNMTFQKALASVGSGSGKGEGMYGGVELPDRRGGCQVRLDF